MTQEWLKRTVDVGPAIEDLLARYGTEQIDLITSSEQYEIAKATLALALNDALNAAGGTARKKRRSAGPLFDKLLNGLAVVFMLGYDQAKQEYISAFAKGLAALPDDPRWEDDDA